MNIFTATRTLGFVAKLFAAAKLNLDEFVAAGDESALQAHIAAHGAAAGPADTTAKDTEIADLKSQLATAKAAAAEHATRHASVVSVLATAGVKFAATDKPEAVTAALESRISMRAGEELAKRSLRDFPEQKIEADPTKPAAVLDAKLPPLSRLAAKLTARSAALN